MSVTRSGRIAMAEKMSVSQLQEAFENKTLPAYIAGPLIEEKLDMEERNRNSIIMQQQAQQQQRPPIIDRVIRRAQLASASGIDRLPTNLSLTRDYAGGIVAFEEGGSVQEPIRFQNQGLVPPEEETSSVFGRAIRSFFGGPAGAREQYEAQQQYLARQRELRERLQQLEGYGIKQQTAQQQAEAAQIRKELIALESQAPARTIKPAADAQATSAKPDEPKVDARLPDTAVAKNVPATTSRPATTGASDQGIAAGLPRPPEFPSAVATTEKLLEGLSKRSAATEKQLAIDLSKNRLQGKAFEGYEQTLKKEAEQAGLDKDQAKYMAMLKAGLAMMAGTSRHALENIGKGAMAGAVDYQEAYKELRKAERERTKEFALIEQARRAEEKGEIDLSRQLLIRAADARNRNDQFGVNAIMQATGLDTDRSLGIWKTQYSAETQLKIADKRTAALMARGAGRGALTPYQMAQLRKEALKNVDENQIRTGLAKSKKLSKTPKAGEDANFDRQVSEAYQKKLNEYMNQLIGISENNPFTGFSMAGMED